jgi:hypothetical protein
MPTITVVVPHRLDREEALERIRRRQSEVEQHYGDEIRNAETTWTGDTLQFRFKTLGMTVQGTVVVEAAQVSVELKVPLAAMLVKGKIESQVRAELERTLAPEEPPPAE